MMETGRLGYLLIGLVFLLSALLTWLLRHYALRRGLVDKPTSRSSHIMETPRGGGLAFVLIYMGLLLWAQCFSLSRLHSFEPLALSLLSGGALVALIGFIDDHRDLSAKLRFLVHLVAAALAVWVLGTPPVSLGDWLIPQGWWLNLLFVLALVWLLNLYNFMDGIDGIASMQAITVLAGASAILLLNQSEPHIVVWLLLLASGVAGFLFWNWPPAKIFMGDAASGFLGFSFGVFACYSPQYHPIALWSWLILLGLFVVDASWTLGVRVMNGEKWYQPHAKHAYQILTRQRQARLAGQGLTPEQARAGAHRWVVMLGLAINVFWLTPMAWFASVYPGYGWLLVVTAFLPLIIAQWRLGAGRRAV
jgi:Fuc2NAc and GlcNAc transferase